MRSRGGPKLHKICTTRQHTPRLYHTSNLVSNKAAGFPSSWTLKCRTSQILARCSDVHGMELVKVYDGGSSSSVPRSSVSFLPYFKTAHFNLFWHPHSCSRSSSLQCFLELVIGSPKWARALR